MKHGPVTRYGKVACRYRFTDVSSVEGDFHVHTGLYVSSVEGDFYVLTG